MEEAAQTTVQGILRNVSWEAIHIAKWGGMVTTVSRTSTNAMIDIFVVMVNVPTLSEVSIVPVPHLSTV